MWLRFRVSKPGMLNIGVRNPYQQALTVKGYAISSARARLHLRVQSEAIFCDFVFVALLNPKPLKLLLIFVSFATYPTQLRVAQGQGSGLFRVQDF